ncbi:MAG: heat shock protein [Mycoplasmataceae bacterium RV_VA103A]|nr:MAG: heat shock protein [Mycoplasmataceae bacterium RV_VA103A]
MNKRSEKESLKQKEVKSKTDPKKTDTKASVSSEPKKNASGENENLELKKLTAEIDNLKKDKLELAAELKNERQNWQRQMEQVYKYSNKKLLNWVLAFLVDLEEKALSAMRADPESSVKTHLLGIEMLRNILWKNLENEGITEIKIVVGQDKWSSRLHELVEEIENDNLPAGTVVKVAGKGYLLADQVLRPAKVIISKKKEQMV